MYPHIYTSPESYLLVFCGQFTQQHEDVVIAEVPLPGCEELQGAHCLPEFVLDAHKPAHGKVVTHSSVVMWALQKADTTSLT